MARGSQSKEVITNKILEVFSGSFINDKEIRIPIAENGETIEIKLTLTAAKSNIRTYDDTAPNSSSIGAEQVNAEPVEAESIMTEVTPEEKEAVAALISRLNL